MTCSFATLFHQNRHRWICAMLGWHHVKLCKWWLKEEWQRVRKSPIGSLIGDILASSSARPCRPARRPPWHLDTQDGPYIGSISSSTKTWSGAARWRWEWWSWWDVSSICWLRHKQLSDWLTDDWQGAASGYKRKSHLNRMKGQTYALVSCHYVDSSFFKLESFFSKRCLIDSRTRTIETYLLTSRAPFRVKLSFMHILENVQPQTSLEKMENRWKWSREHSTIHTLLPYHHLF